MAAEGQDVVSLLRRLETRRNARRRYIAEHRRLEQMSRDLYHDGQFYEAEGAHYWAMVALRAAEAELSDRQPR